MSKAERGQRIEKVIHHMLGVSSLDDEELRAISDSIDHSNKLQSAEHELSAEGSLLTFSKQLEQQLVETGSSNKKGSDYEGEAEAEDEAIARFCRSPSPASTSEGTFVDSIAAILPSEDVADHLIRVCFEYVQCNSFYADQKWAHQSLHACYADASSLSGRNIPTMATLTMLMALGTQFTPDLSLAHLGTTLYNETIKALPVLIEQSNFESIRACLLLATYCFPVNHSGLAYTYLGLALHMAMRNNMHKICQNEVEVRVWWTLYTFYQRARIIHGHPKTLSCTEVSVRRPQLCQQLEPADGVSNFCNQVALIEVTITLERIADEM